MNMMKCLEKNVRPLVQPMLTEFVRSSVLSPTSEHAKTLTSAIIDLIGRDLRPISVVDGTGFFNLMNVTSKRASLDHSNVEKLVFLHDNLPFPHHLNYKRVKCSCEDCKNQ